MGSSPAERYAAARALAKHEATRLARFEAQYDFPLDDFQLEGCRAGVEHVTQNFSSHYDYGCVGVNGVISS